MKTKIYKTAQGTGTGVQQLLQFPPSLILFGFTWPIVKFLLHIYRERAHSSYTVAKIRVGTHERIHIMHCAIFISTNFS